MNKITERIEELEREILLGESVLKECVTPYCKATLAVKIYGQKVEILELRLYLLSLINSIEEELKTLDSHCARTFYKKEDIEIMLKSFKV